MSGLIIEGGVFFLLLFIPFAFGGVETWAEGILQIVAGIVFAAWALGEGARRGVFLRRSGDGHAGATKRTRFMWAALAAFILLAILQMMPLPGTALRILSPGTHDLYARTLPGYAQGDEFRTGELPSWLLNRMSDRMPEGVRAGSVVPPTERSPLAERYATRHSAWRPMSIYPFRTRENLTLILCYAGLFAAIAGHFRTKERLSRLVGVFVLSGLAVSFFGIVQKLNWNGKLYGVREGVYLEPFGPFVNRNSYAALAGTILPLALCMALGALRSLREGTKEAVGRLIFYSFASITLSVGIFYSLSRGGMICAVLAIAIVAALLAMLGKHRTELLLLAGLVVAAIGLLTWIGPEKVIERAQTISEGQSTPTIWLRITAWKRTTGLLADHLLLGTGLGTFQFSFLRYAPPGQNWWTTAHNEYLEILCDTGLVGGAIAAFGAVCYFLRVLKPAPFRGRRSRYAFTGMVAGITGLLIHSMISSNLQVPANGLALTTLCAALLSLVQNRRARRSSAADAEGAAEEAGDD